MAYKPTNPINGYNQGPPTLQPGKYHFVTIEPLDSRFMVNLSLKLPLGPARSRVDSQVDMGET